MGFGVHGIFRGFRVFVSYGACYLGRKCQDLVFFFKCAVGDGSLEKCLHQKIAMKLRGFYIDLRRYFFRGYLKKSRERSCSMRSRKSPATKL